MTYDDAQTGDLAALKPIIDRRFALVMGQKNQLWWDLPARESLELNAKIYGIPTDRAHIVGNSAGGACSSVRSHL